MEEVSGDDTILFSIVHGSDGMCKVKGQPESYNVKHSIYSVEHIVARYCMRNMQL